MKKVLISLVCIIGLSLAIFIYFTTRGYSGEYVQWGENNSVDSQYLDRLEENDIPYKIKDGNMYIPEDAIDDATLCCT